MSNPIPNHGKTRLHWDFRRGRAWAGGVLQPGSPVAKINTIRAAAASAPTFDGDLTAFAANVTRATDRGVLMERQSTQLLTNSAMIGAALGEVGNGGQLPIGWNVTPGVIAHVEGFGRIGGPAYCIVKILFDNTANSEIATIRLNLEAIGAVPVPAGRVACFSGIATVLELSNAFDPQMRSIIRDADTEIDGDDGARTITGLNIGTPFAIVPVISPTGVSLNPVATVRINAGAVGYMRIKLDEVQDEEATSPTTWIRSTPDVYAGGDLYPYYPFTGAVLGRIRIPGITEGTGGRLPDGVSNSSMDDVEIIGIGTEEAGDVTLRLKVNGNAVGSLTERTGVLRLCPNDRFAAAPGQRWQAGIVARVLACPADVTPKLRVGGRTSGGVATRPVLIDGGDIALGGRKAESVNTGVLPALTAFATTAINITVPNGTTAVVEIRLFRPTNRLMSLVALASGPVTRPQDVNTIPSAPADFALPCTIVIDYEHRSLDPVQNVLALQFGARRVQLLMGDQVGVVVADGGGAIATLAQAANGSHGAMKLAVSITNTSIAVGFPDAAGYGYASADLPPLGACTGAWLGSYGELYPATGFAREITVKAGAVPAANLPGLTRSEWGPRHYRQRIGLSKPPSLDDVDAIVGNIIDAPGPAFAAFPIASSSRYYRRTNGGAAITSVLPDPAAAYAVAPFFRITLVNTGAGTNTITAAGGAPVSFDYLGSDTAYVQPGNSHTMFVSDGTRWNYATLPGEPFQPREQVPCVSIYGPDRPGNENRDQLYGPNVAAFYIVIDSVRTMHAYIIENMNAYVETGDLNAAARCAKIMLIWCRHPYWIGPTTMDQVGLSSLTNLPEAPIAILYSLFGIRFAGVLTTAEIKDITDWVDARMQDARLRFIPLRDECLALQAANNWTISGLQNHSWKFALASSMAAIALNRHDYLADGKQLFKIGMDDVAAVPGSIGAQANEISRGDRCVNYLMLALAWHLGNSEVLIGFGFDTYSYANNALKLASDFAMRACDAPEIVTAEQARMLGLGVTGTQYPITPTSQLGIGFGGVQDDATGQFLFAESRVAGGYICWCRLTDEEVAWLDRWAPRWRLYVNSYTTRLGGSQTTLYPCLAQIVYAVLRATLRPL